MTFYDSNAHFVDEVTEAQNQIIISQDPLLMKEGPEVNSNHCSFL